MSFLDPLLVGIRRIFLGGVQQPLEPNLNFDSDYFSSTDNPATHQTTISFIASPDYSTLPGLSTNAYTGTGTVAEVVPTETSLGFGSSSQVDGFTGSLTTSTATATTIATIAVPTSNPWKHMIDVSITVMGIDQSATSLGTIGIYRGDLTFSALYDSASGAVQLCQPTNPQNVRTSGTAVSNSWAGVTLSTPSNSSGNVLVQVAGDPSHTVKWTCIGQVQRGT